MGQNNITGQPYALNPLQFASPQGTQLAQAAIQALLGKSGVATAGIEGGASGPFSYPGQSAIRVPDASDSFNAGLVADLYSRYGKATADSIMQEQLARATSGKPADSKPPVTFANPQVGQASQVLGVGAPPLTSSVVAPPLLPGSETSQLGSALAGLPSIGSFGLDKIKTPMIPSGSAFGPPQPPTDPRLQINGMSQLMALIQQILATGQYPRITPNTGGSAT